MTLFSKRLKEIRIKNNMTQKQLGDLINVTKVSICCYEKGTRTPSLDTLMDLANVFKLSIDYFLGNDKYIVADDDKEYGMYLSKEEINIVKKLRNYNEVYEKLINDPVRTLELINKKLK